MREDYHDEELKRRLSTLKRIPAPESALTKLYDRIRAVKYRTVKYRTVKHQTVKHRTGKEKYVSARPNPFFSLLFNARVAIITAVVTLSISIPLTFFFTRSYSITPIKKTYVVRFVYENQTAEKVYLVGDFTSWSKNRVGMQKVKGTDYWTVEISLEEGIYKYVFLVDESLWTPDPLSNIKVLDDFGNESSLMVLLNNAGGVNL